MIIRRFHARLVCRALLWTLACGVMLPAPVAAQQDHFRIIELEQEIRALERIMAEQTRRIRALEERLARLGDQPRQVPTSEPSASDADAPWLTADNWARVRAGMVELEVIDVLGPPTTIRQADDGTTLLYALELGRSGFLSGSVYLQGGRVTDVERPRLK